MLLDQIGRLIQEERPQRVDDRITYQPATNGTGIGVANAAVTRVILNENQDKLAREDGAGRDARWPRERDGEGCRLDSRNGPHTAQDTGRSTLTSAHEPERAQESADGVDQRQWWVALDRVTGLSTCTASPRLALAEAVP